MILQLKDIKLSFADARSEVFNLLNGVNLSIEKGKITALVGGNGSGKTTIFNIISGFQGDYEGDVFFEGKSLKGVPSHKRSLRGIGRLFQGRQLMGDLTLMENMKIASNDTMGEIPFSLSLFTKHIEYTDTRDRNKILKFVHKIGVFLCFWKRIEKAEKEKEQKAIEILTRLFGEGNKYLSMLDHKASDFSYGEQRIIAIARLMMGNNDLLLLDEPTAGVNPVYIETIKEVIKKMVAEDKITVLLIEHNMHFVRDLADTCAFLDEGVVQRVGETSSVLDDKEVRNSYLGL